MTRKTEECYRHVFRYIHENIFSLECESFMTDFELAMRNALRSIYPDCKFYVCWFHLTKAAEKKVSQTSALCKLIRKKKEARIIYKKILALPLLPADLIVAAFHKIKVLALSTFEQFGPFLVYFEHQWLQRVSVLFITNRLPCNGFCLPESI